MTHTAPPRDNVIVEEYAAYLGRPVLGEELYVVADGAFELVRDLSFTEAAAYAAAEARVFPLADIEVRVQR